METSSVCWLWGQQNKLITEQWQQSDCTQKLGDTILYVTGDALCTKITTEEVGNIEDLRTSYEEADAHIRRHCKHAVHDVTIVITVEDTGIIILRLGVQSSTESAIFVNKSGSTTRTRYVDISEIANAIDNDVCGVCRAGFTGQG